MKQLIKMSDYVLEQIEKLKNSEINILQFRNNIEAYANFLKKPLTIGMFVACDDEGNVLEDIIGNGMIHNYSEKVKQYQQAKAKVLFEVNFNVIDRKTYKILTLDGKNIWVSWNKSKTIEDLIPYNLELTYNQF